MAGQGALCGNGADLVAPRLEVIEHGLSRVEFELQAVAAVRERLAEEKPGPREGGERIHAVIDQARQHRRERLRLPVRALRPVEQPRTAVPEIHAGIEGVERARSGAQPVDAARLHAEGRAAIVPEDAGIARDDAASPVEIDRLEQADAVAVPVGRPDEDGVAGLEDVRPGRRLAPIDASGQRVEMGGRQQPLDGDLGENGIGDEAVAVDEGELHRLDEEVVVVGAALRDGGQVEAVEDAHDLEGRQPLGRRTQADELPAAIGHAQRALVPGTAASEVVRRQRRARLLQPARDPLGQLALVEVAAAILRQRCERAGEVGLAKRLTGLRDAAGVGEHAHDIGPVADLLGAEVRPEALRRRQGEAVRRAGDGALEQPLPGLPPAQGSLAVGEGLVPGIDGRRRRDRRSGATERDRPAVLRQIRGRLTDAGQGEAGAVAVADDHERVAAQAAEMRVGHAEGGVDGDRRLDGVAPCPQHLPPGLAGEFVRARHHALAGSGEGAAGGARLGEETGRHGRRPQGSRGGQEKRPPRRGRRDGSMVFATIHGGVPPVARSDRAGDGCVSPAARCRYSAISATCAAIAPEVVSQTLSRCPAIRSSACRRGRKRCGWPTM